jgi:hypothetical protein
MQNELQNKVVQWLELSAQAIGDFAVREIPPFINEYLQWKFVEALITGGGGFILSCILSVGVYKCARRAWRWITGDDCDPAVVLIGFGALIGFIVNIHLFIFSLTNLKDALQIKLAPKVYLIEKASELIKQ